MVSSRTPSPLTPGARAPQRSEEMDVSNATRDNDNSNARMATNRPSSTFRRNPGVVANMAEDPEEGETGAGAAMNSRPTSSMSGRRQDWGEWEDINGFEEEDNTESSTSIGHLDPSTDFGRCRIAARQAAAIQAHLSLGPPRRSQMRRLPAYARPSNAAPAVRDPTPPQDLSAQTGRPSSSTTHSTRRPDVSTQDARSTHVSSIGRVARGARTHMSWSGFPRRDGFLYGLGNFGDNLNFKKKSDFIDSALRSTPGASETKDWRIYAQNIINKEDLGALGSFFKERVKTAAGDAHFEELKKDRKKHRQVWNPIGSLSQYAHLSPGKEGDYAAPPRGPHNDFTAIRPALPAPSPAANPLVATDPASSGRCIGVSDPPQALTRQQPPSHPQAPSVLHPPLHPAGASGPQSQLHHTQAQRPQLDPAGMHVYSARENPGTVYPMDRPWPELAGGYTIIRPGTATQHPSSSIYLPGHPASQIQPGYPQVSTGGDTGHSGQLASTLMPLPSSTRPLSAQTPAERTQSHLKQYTRDMNRIGSPCFLQTPGRPYLPGHIQSARPKCTSALQVPPPTGIGLGNAAASHAWLGVSALERPYRLVLTPQGTTRVIIAQYDPNNLPSQQAPGNHSASVGIAADTASGSDVEKLALSDEEYVYEVIETEEDAKDDEEEDEAIDDGEYVEDGNEDEEDDENEAD